jgi:uncharacterized protein YkwD
MKKIIITLCLTILAITFLGCAISRTSSPEFLLDAQAAVREYDPNDTTIYIVDPFVPLADSTNSEGLRQMAQAAMALVNAKRAAAGLGALSWSLGLEQAACVRANEIESFFSHTRPDGSEYWTANGNLIYGENLAKGFNDADSVVSAWAASPTHNANLMDPGFTSCSIAIHESNGTMYWSQEFGY